MALDVNRIQGSLQKVRKLLKKMSSVPSVRDVHRLRTNSRRIEAMLPVLSLDSDRNGRRILKQISKLRKRAGKVRDMDVLIGYTSDMPHDGEEKECSTQLLEYLGAERVKHSNKLYDLKEQYAPNLRKSLQKAAREVGRTLQSSRPHSGRQDATSMVTASALRLSSDLMRPARLGRRNLHPYRLKVKELRNQLQMAQNADQQEFVEELGKLKDAIGEWHDWEELLAIAKEVLEHEPNCRFQRELRRIADSKYHDALALTETMRKKFLHPSGAKRPSRRKIAASAEPVWSAASALAA